MHLLLVMHIKVTLEFKTDVKDITTAMQSFYQMRTAGPGVYVGTVCCMFIPFCLACLCDAAHSGFLETRKSKTKENVLTTLLFSQQAS
jgi:hypothetical protein